MQDAPSKPSTAKVNRSVKIGFPLLLLLLSILIATFVYHPFSPSSHTPSNQVNQQGFNGTQQLNISKLKPDKKVVIGLSFSDFETERWPVEHVIMSKLAQSYGAKIIAQIANHDPILQNNQISNLIKQNVDVLIIIAEDGEKTAVAVEKAIKSGIPVLAYDRLIKSPHLSGYISFDNVEVGRIQAQSILHQVNKGSFVLLGGSPTDNNAALNRKGQLEILQPFIDSKEIHIIADQWINNWSAARAEVIMNNILEQHGSEIDGIIASNDGTALGAIEALRNNKLAGEIPISGQDATLAGCRSILSGELSMTVFKDVRLLSPMAIKMAIMLASAQEISGLSYYKLSELTGNPADEGEVPCKFLPVKGVDKSNMQEIVIESGFQKATDIFASTLNSAL